MNGKTVLTLKRGQPVAFEIPDQDYPALHPCVPRTGTGVVHRVHPDGDIEILIDGSDELFMYRPWEVTTR